ncbi:MAG: hypothetical protein KBA66_03190 [Leptospiraceae bacterium]|nr:hypothetical protein [Leptospiraceae bacterium]
MKALETIVDTTETRFITLELPPEIKPGKHKLVIVVYEEFLEDSAEEILSPEIDQAYKDELDIRLTRMQKEPHAGYTWEESIQILEKRFGKKIKA